MTAVVQVTAVACVQSLAQELPHAKDAGLIIHCTTSGTPYFFFFFFFLGPNPRHMDVPRLGVKSELKLLDYTTTHGNARSIQ